LSQFAEDAALMFATLTKDRSAFSQARVKGGKPPSLQGLRVGVFSERDLRDLQPDIGLAYDRAVATFRIQGAQLRNLDLPATFDDFAEVASAIMLSEAGARWGHFTNDETLPMHKSVRPRIAAGTKFTAVRYVQANRRRDELKQLFADAFGDLDVFLTPTSQWTARPLDGVDHGVPPVRYARIANLLDLYGISVQMGEDEGGLPIGLQGPGRPAQTLAFSKRPAPSKQQPRGICDRGCHRKTIDSYIYLVH